jgi:hypothetical protein
VPTTSYFDTNTSIDIFEDRKPGLFPKLESHVKSGNLQVVASDVLLVEMLEGNHLPKFKQGAARLFSVSPKWLYLVSLTAREVILEYDSLVVTDPVGALLDWKELLPLITEHADISAYPNLKIPTPEALLQFYPPGMVKQLLGEYDTYLDERQKALATRLKHNGKDEVFRWLVVQTLNKDPRGTAFATALLADPDRAPAFRLAFELDCNKAGTVSSWLKNPFFDRLHVGAIPYVDLFVTSDGTLIKQLEWYDRNIRIAAGKPPYMPKVCRDFAEFENRI